MRRKLGLGLLVVVAVLVVLTLVSASDDEDGPVAADPATYEAVDGSDLLRITLTESAAERLGIETDTVENGNGDTLVVPSAAMIITPDGKHWVYTNPEGLVYLRHEITEVVEEDHRAYYADGPTAGTRVVVTGVPELYGAEFGIGK